MTRIWTEEAIVEAIRAWAETHDGYPPTGQEWTRAGAGRPVLTTVHRRFGSWNAAIEAAGFTALRRDQHRAGRRAAA